MPLLLGAMHRAHTADVQTRLQLPAPTLGRSYSTPQQPQHLLRCGATWHRRAAGQQWSYDPLTGQSRPRQPRTCAGGTTALAGFEQGYVHRGRQRAGPAAALRSERVQP
eukprot:237733-Chlamydomonas_euryale.AAC.10